MAIFCDALVDGGTLFPARNIYEILKESKFPFAVETGSNPILYFDLKENYFDKKNEGVNVNSINTAIIRENGKFDSADNIVYSIMDIQYLKRFAMALKVDGSGKVYYAESNDGYTWSLEQQNN